MFLASLKNHKKAWNLFAEFKTSILVSIYYTQVSYISISSIFILKFNSIQEKQEKAYFPLCSNVFRDIDF